MLHCYCIRLEGHPSPGEDLLGIDGEPVTAIYRAGLSMWVSDVLTAPPDAERLRQHEAVVRAALRKATPLPLRFGTRFSDRAAAEAALEQRGDEFMQMLKEFEGKVEMGLRVDGGAGSSRREPEESPSDGPPRGSGRAYLEARRRDIRARSAALDELDRQMDLLDSALAGLGWKSARAILPGDPPTGSLAHLVRRTEVLSYRDRVSELEADNPHLRIAVSGPWAPYSFVR